MSDIYAFVFLLILIVLSLAILRGLEQLKEK
jgi:hypothetical protein